ncbi:hypothetical protein CAC42_7282 [Sphaceloma murrayae]|uniref:Trafficking protein particle complex subunit 13 N-terminal domain-containing protein n=1 Tax=Sphaceloma murrayae TaxID=2082308 RepID=A0A2K1QWJ8_9PEZI|nr:hypothetical protein CAC42_7282 [Sphaceloma murrayae]
MPPRASQSSGPHSVSLKVLRLSKPSLTQSNTLPPVTNHPSIQSASLPYPSATPRPLPLSPLLTLPPSFGAAYVGETFSCTLSANNELLANSHLSISSVHVEAELQTPGENGTIPLVVHSADDAAEDDTRLDRGASRQSIICHDLKEEGPHVLAVTVTYAEHEREERRVRTFRKLYQFAAQQAVGVRTKIGELRWAGSGMQGITRRKSFAVEAQIENLTEENVVVEDVKLELGRGVGCKGLNGDGGRWLAPGDVEQVAFRLEEEGQLEVEAGRWVLAQLKVDWRMGMGQDGTLKTGWLGCLKRD